MSRNTSEQQHHHHSKDEDVIMPLTDAIYVRRNENNAGFQQYTGGISILRPCLEQHHQQQKQKPGPLQLSCRQRLLVGDLMAYSKNSSGREHQENDDEDDDDILAVNNNHETLFCSSRHSIGQLLAVYRQVGVDNNNNINDNNEYFVVLRPLLHWETLEPQLSQAQKRELRNTCRANCGLYETTTTPAAYASASANSANVVVTLSARRVLPMAIRVVDKWSGAEKFYKHQTIRLPFQPQQQAMASVAVANEYRFFVYGSYVDHNLKANKDWKGYHALCARWFEKSSHTGTGSTSTTTPLFPGPLLRGWECLKKHEPKLVAALNKKLIDALGEMQDRWVLETTSPADAEQQDSEEEEVEEEVEEEEDCSPSTNKENRNKRPRGRPAPKKKQPVPPKKKLKTISTAKQPPPQRKAVVPKMQKKKATFASAVSAPPPQPPQHHQQPVSVHPIGTKVHHAKDRGIDFYSEVQVGAMNICVGDVLAVAAGIVDKNKNKNGTTKRKHASSGADWTPFDQPWNAGQVLSIYQTTKKKKSASIDIDESNSTTLEMEVRWFYWPKDLPFKCPASVFEPLDNDDDDDWDPNSSVIEVDEHVSRVPVTAALGRVLFHKKNIHRPLLRAKNDESAVVPVAHLTCRFIYCSQWDERCIRPILGSNNNDDDDGWTNYGSKLAGPLSRALLCERGWPGKYKLLQREYKKFVVDQYKLKSKKLDCGKTLRLAEQGISTNDGGSRGNEGGDDDGLLQDRPLDWPARLLEDTQVLVPPDYRPIWKSNEKSVEFLSSVLVPVNKRCDPRATASKTRTVHWTLQVGDVVCFANTSASSAAVLTSTANNHNRHGGREQATNMRRNPWYPYLGPWTVCQILSIYRRGDDNGISQPMVELRRFLRKEDLPPRVQEWMPLQHTKEEQVFETDMIERDVPASHVLGPVQMFYAHSTKASKEQQELVPTVACRCRFFYSHTEQRFQALYCNDKTPAGWGKFISERGFKASGFIQEHSELRAGIEFCLDVPLDSDGLEALFGNMFNCNVLASCNDTDTPVLQQAMALREQPISVGTDAVDSATFYLSVPVQPQWSAFAEAEKVCAPRYRQGLFWTARVGDVVAVRTDEDSSANSEQELFPFTQPWRPGQVLAIHQEGNGQDNFSLQIRWFDRRKGGDSPASKDDLELLYETDDVCDEPIDRSRLLGPVAMMYNDCSTASAIWDSLPSFLPAAPLVLQVAHQKQQDMIKNISKMIERGFDLCSYYNADSKINVLGQLREEAEDLKGKGDCYQLPLHLLETSDATPVSPSSSNDSFEARFWAPDPPLHISATGEKFFGRVCFTPKLDAYWDVRVGDPAVIVYGKKEEEGVGEVVTIFQPMDVNDSESTLSGSSGKCDNIMLEIRWLYKENEVPGKRCRSQNENTDSPLEEVYESDHYDQFSVSCLRGPAILHDGNGYVDGDGASRSVGVDIQEFRCRRFWSVHRKSFKPSGSLAGRITRGRTQSSKCKNDFGLRSALERLDQTETLVSASDQTSPAVTRRLSPAEAFRRVIEKLSLTDASKEAHANGSALIGRDKERGKIMMFLRAAIAGHAEDKNSSLFVAGPPGVGKTASVRAAISDLRREQSAGKLPAFDFITLNGMEMRDPYEAYIKLWEEISGDKTLCNAQLACSRLQAYFSMNNASGVGDENRIVVVLLDEIDYIVTKSQDVLYNFFDWPIHALKCPRRLVVVGVSNTLNLPERMHPRVQSRIGSMRCYFKSYNAQEITDILKSKIQQACPKYAAFNDDAITFAAKKTAALSGDIRKAFRICRAAAELILNKIENGSDGEPTPIVTMHVVNEVIRASANSAQSRRITLSSPFEALMLVALASLTKSTGRERGGFDVEEVVTKMDSTANALGDSLYLPAPSLCEALDILTRLCEAHFVGLRTPRNASLSYRASLAGSGGAWPLVSTLLDDTAILTALKTTPHQKLAEKYLGNSFTM